MGKPRTLFYTYFSPLDINFHLSHLNRWLSFYLDKKIPLANSEGVK